MKTKMEKTKKTTRTMIAGIILTGCATTALIAACAGSTTRSCGQNQHESGYYPGCETDYVWTKTFSTYTTCTVEYSSGSTGCLPDGTNTCIQTMETVYSVENPPDCVNTGPKTNQWSVLKSKPNNEPCPATGG